MLRSRDYVVVSLATTTCRDGGKPEMVMDRQRGRSQVLEGFALYPKEFVGQ